MKYGFALCACDTTRRASASRGVTWSAATGARYDCLTDLGLSQRFNLLVECLPIVTSFLVFFVVRPLKSYDKQEYDTSDEVELSIAQQKKSKGERD